MATDIVHRISNGVCVDCGDTAEWLTERGQRVAYLPQNAWTVVDPNGVPHSKKKGSRQYTHALIRQNRGSDSYFVNWATSEDKARKESRVHAGQRSYVAIIALDEAN